VGYNLQTRPKNQPKLRKKSGGRRVRRTSCCYKSTKKKIDSRQVDIPVVLAMRYGNPSMLSGLQKLRDQGVTEGAAFSFVTSAACYGINHYCGLADEVAYQKRIFQK
jgi:ferrochelatase